MGKSWFQRRLSCVGRRIQGLAGEPATYCRGESSTALYVVPIHEEPEELAEGQLRTEAQNFVVQMTDLCIDDTFITPRNGDRIIWNNSIYAVCGGLDTKKIKRPSGKFTTSTMERIIVCTNRIGKEQDDD